MICPYLLKNVKTVYNTQNIYEEETQLHTSTRYIENIDREYMRCGMSNCAVWYDNRCNFNGSKGS